MNKVKGYRNMLLLTQKEMAENLRMSEGQYRAKEKGKYDFSQSEMKLFMDMLKNNGIDSTVELIFFN